MTTNPPSQPIKAACNSCDRVWDWKQGDPLFCLCDGELSVMSKSPTVKAEWEQEHDDFWFSKKNWVTRTEMKPLIKKWIAESKAELLEKVKLIINDCSNERYETGQLVEVLGSKLASIDGKYLEERLKSLHTKETTE